MLPAGEKVENADTFAFFAGRNGPAGNDDLGPFEPLATALVSTVGGSTDAAGVIEVKGLTKAS